MKMAIGMVILAMLCVFIIPAERWYGMSEAQQGVVLDELGKDAMEEMECGEVDIEVFDIGPVMRIYVTCSEEKFIALWKWKK